MQFPDNFGFPIYFNWLSLIAICGPPTIAVSLKRVLALMSKDFLGLLAAEEFSNEIHLSLREPAFVTITKVLEHEPNLYAIVHESIPCVSQLEARFLRGAKYLW